MSVRQLLFLLPESFWPGLVALAGAGLLLLSRQDIFAQSTRDEGG